MFRKSLIGWAGIPCLLAAVLLLPARPGTAQETALDRLRDDPSLIAEGQFETLERLAQEVAARAAACTVGLQVGSAMGSGVIVTPDGYIATAAHVAGRPGRRVRIELPDGMRLEGRTLGLHTEADGALVKIDGDGPWPYAPLVEPDEAPQVGQWCLAMGHPGGFDRRRGAPVRLGRVVEVYGSVLHTDCPIMSGDSGGPLFDLRGRVIGIHSRIAEDVTDNFHSPALAISQAWDVLADGKVYPVRPASRFLELLDADNDGRLTRSELPPGAKRRALERLAEIYQRDPDKGIAIDQFAVDVLKWRRSLTLDFGRPSEQDAETVGLPQRLFVRGRRLRQAFEPAIQAARQSTVRLTSDGRQLALGAVVSNQGAILTKASELDEGEILCQLPDGRQYPAERVAVAEDLDLALLKIDTDGLDPIAWKTKELPVGSWIVTPDQQGRAANVGVVSLAARRIPRAQAVMGVEIDTDSPRPRVQQVMPRGGADQAGMEEGDVIVRIEEKDIHSFDELRDALQAFRAGDVVNVVVERGEQTRELEVTLAARDEVFYRFGIQRMNGAVSRRHDDFPLVVQHDSPLRPSLCGGPAVDSSGDAVGINIARADRISAYLLPYSAFQSWLDEHLDAPTDDQDGT